MTVLWLAIAILFVLFLLLAYLYCRLTDVVCLMAKSIIPIDKKEVSNGSVIVTYANGESYEISEKEWKTMGKSIKK